MTYFDDLCSVWKSLTRSLTLTDVCIFVLWFISMLFLFFFLVCLFFFFFQNVATNGCLTQTSRIISQGYTCIYYVLPFPLHIILITPQHYWEITTGIVFRISHQTLHLFPQKLDWILTWITNWLFSERVFSVCRLFSVLVLEMHLYLRGISLILPSVLSMAPRSISVCCCVLSCTNKTRPPPSPHCVAFHRCLVPAMNLPPDMEMKSVPRAAAAMFAGSVACVGITPTTMNSICVLLCFSLFKL